MAVKCKYHVGDKVRIKRHHGVGKIGVITNISKFRLYGRRTFIVKCDNWEDAFVSYELELLSPAKSEEQEKTLDGDKSSGKMVIIFDEDIFKNAPANVTDYVKRNATKINANGTVLKNRYGHADVKEKVFSISLEEAQKMYKNGGALKEFVLKHFTEDELNPKPKLPHTWEEYCADFYPYGCHLHYTPNFAHGFRKEDCDAIIAFGRLVRVYRTWIGKWKPNWDKETAHKTIKYCIINSVDGFIIQNCYNNWIPFFAFPTKEMAEEFKNSFKDLLEKAKILI